MDSGLIDLVIVGEIDRAYFDQLSEKIEGLIGRKIRGLILKRNEFDRLRDRLKAEGSLLLWDGDGAAV